MGEHGFEIAVGVDQFGRGLDADTRNARHIVGAVPTQRLHVDDLVRSDAELLAHLGLGDRTIGHRVAHFDTVADELHQVFVGGQDCNCRSRLDSLAGVSCDKVVRLEVRQLDLANIERRRRAADML